MVHSNLFPRGKIGMVLFQLESELEWFHSNWNDFIPIGIRIGTVHSNLFPIGRIGMVLFQLESELEWLNSNWNKNWNGPFQFVPYRKNRNGFVPIGIRIGNGFIPIGMVSFQLEWSYSNWNGFIPICSL